MDPPAEPADSADSADPAAIDLRPRTFLDDVRLALGPAPSYRATRFFILRLLGVVYFFAFLSLARQLLPLLGSHGLSPVADFLAASTAGAGSRWAAFKANPSLFYVAASDRVLLAGAWLGVAVSLLVALGRANAIAMALLWALYLSFVHVGQLWYGFGWEIQLCETGFLAIFLCPLLDPSPFSARPPPTPVIWLYRWLIFRIMFGAGLIKLRGDACWTDLTCLYYHYETQPIPNPVSRLLHFAPHWFHKAGVLYNHLCELCAPWFLWWPRRARHVAGTLLLGFQLFLIVSGNLSFLNWLTIVPVLACFDDSLLRRVLPGALARRLDRAATEPRTTLSHRVATWLLVAVVALLSVDPVLNLASHSQRMNASFDPLELVNTYGAFGSVGKERNELVFEGTRDEVPGDDARWIPYEFPCKPGDPARRPCVLGPYHYRLDWEIWFAAMSSPRYHSWTIRLIWKLLHNDPLALSLLDGNPFPGAPPRWIRVSLYRYRFAPLGAGVWWTREYLGEWLPPLSVDEPELLRFLDARGWRDE